MVNHADKAFGGSFFFFFFPFCKSLTLTGMLSIRFHNTETHEMAVSPLLISPFTSFEDRGEESALIAKEILLRGQTQGEICRPNV